MAFDGAKASYNFQDEEKFSQWRNQTNKIRTWLDVWEDTGEIKAQEDQGNGHLRVDRSGKYRWFTVIREARYRYYDIIIREKNYEVISTGQQRKTYRGEFSGSFSTNFHGGENWIDLGFDELQQELERIGTDMKLELSAVKLDNLEIVVTVEQPYNVSDFINNNVMAYRNMPCNRYSRNKKGKSLGKFCELTDGTVIKIYDKSCEYDLPNNLLRFEIRFKKMYLLNDLGIYYLSDLQDWNKVNSLLDLLLSYFDRVLIYDPDIDKNDPRLTNIQRDMVTRGRAFEYWEDLRQQSSNGTYYNRLDEFKSISKLYGGDYHNKIRQAFISKWNKLMVTGDSCKNLPGVKTEKLEFFTSTVGSNSLQLNNTDRNNNNSVMSTITSTQKDLINSEVQHKSKKQIAKEKREAKEMRFQSFLKELGIRLQELKEQGINS